MNIETKRGTPIRIVAWDEESGYVTVQRIGSGQYRCMLLSDIGGDPVLLTRALRRQRAWHQQSERQLERSK